MGDWVAFHWEKLIFLAQRLGKLFRGTILALSIYLFNKKNLQIFVLKTKQNIIWICRIGAITLSRIGPWDRHGWLQSPHWHWVIYHVVSSYLGSHSQVFSNQSWDIQAHSLLPFVALKQGKDFCENLLIHERMAFYVVYCHWNPHFREDPFALTYRVFLYVTRRTWVRA